MSLIFTSNGKHITTYTCSNGPQGSAAFYTFTHTLTMYIAVNNVSIITFELEFMGRLDALYMQTCTRPLTVLQTFSTSLP